MQKVKPLPSELRRRKLSGTMKKHVEMKYGKVTAELFGKCIGMQRTAAKARMDDPGELMLWQIWAMDAEQPFTPEEVQEIMGR